MTQPRRTIAEQLDAAENGDQFLAALNNLFAVLDTARDGETDDE
jgi:hypothetical protein